MIYPCGTYTHAPFYWNNNLSHSAACIFDDFRILFIHLFYTAISLVDLPCLRHWVLCVATGWGQLVWYMQIWISDNFYMHVMYALFAKYHIDWYRLVGGRAANNTGSYVSMLCNIFSAVTYKRCARLTMQCRPINTCTANFVMWSAITAIIESINIDSVLL